MPDSLGGERTRRNDRKGRPNCPCGSGLPRRTLEDARGIFCTYVCNDCEARQRAKYRADIFTNPNYQTDEPIEPDDPEAWADDCAAHEQARYDCEEE